MVSTRSSTRKSRSNSTSTSPPTKKRAQQPKSPSTAKKRKLRAPPPPGSPSAQLHSEREEDAGRRERAREGGVLEKGLVYFFFRSKVAVESAGGLEDVKRGYIVLKPLKLGEGVSVGGEGSKGEGKCRLLAVPKKRLPTRGFEKFLTFVEEPNITVRDLKDRFLKGSRYTTKTRGERVDSAAEPIGEGVYALVKHPKERSSHLAYHLTIPEHASEIQSEFGIKDRGSFIVSVKNPSAPAPRSVAIADPAEFPKEVMDEFGGLRWLPLGREHLECKNAQMLFIGEREVLEGKEHEVAGEELKELEEEDGKRVEHLKGDEAVFRDLELDRGEYVGVKSNW
ncbi:unnamed protein product [Tuber aestivum]|uniref:Uncharacterized protein n=1 Tax=Tuber aestivum TaxID=59557 RepID=A0A292PUP3_9PEZI|nr:unnamed protein product [Tuber aestivum]